MYEIKKYSNLNLEIPFFVMEGWSRGYSCVENEDMESNAEALAEIPLLLDNIRTYLFDYYTDGIYLSTLDVKILVCAICQFYNYNATTDAAREYAIEAIEQFDKDRANVLRLSSLVDKLDLNQSTQSTASLFTVMHPELTSLTFS